MDFPVDYPYPEWESYSATLIDLTLDGGARFELTAHEDVQAGAWPFLESEDAWIVTACNPRSQPLSESENHDRHRRLHAELTASGAATYLAEGRDAHSPWREPGYLLPGDQGTLALEAAKRWEQNAVFHWTTDGLAIVGVLQPGYLRFGWRLTRPIG